MDTKYTVALITCITGILLIVVPESAMAESPWPMFQHDAQHTGRSPFIGPQVLNDPNTQIQVLLEGEANDDYFGTPVIGSDGTLYLIARITKAGQTKEGLWAFTKDGNQKWFYPAGGISVMPALWEPSNTVYVALGGLFAINSDDGNLKWSKTGFPASVTRNLIISDTGIVYFLAGIPGQPSDWGLYAIDDEGQVLWVCPITGIEADLTISKQGDIYFGHSTSLFAIDPNGTPKWEKVFEEGWSVKTPAVGDDGTIFVIGGGYWASKLGCHFPYFNAINPSDPNEEKWRAAGAYFKGDPIISPTGNIYITRWWDSWGSDVSYLIGFDSEGKSWSSEQYLGRLDSLIVDASETIYGLSGNTLMAFDKQGNLLWSYYLGSQRSGPLSLGKDGTLYVGGQKKLYAIKPLPEKPLAYAIVVSADGRLKRGIDHSANNAYRTLRNLGLNDDCIFYLNNQSQDIDGDGDSEVDAPATLNDFENAINTITENIGEQATPVILYLVGHGQQDFFHFNGDSLYVLSLNEMLGRFPSGTTILAVIVSCFSGSFITIDPGNVGDSISAENRIIITSAHNQGIRGIVPDWLWFSDRFWGKMNEGLNVREAFTRGATASDATWRWLDDNGDMQGHSPYFLGDDGELAASTQIGIPGSEDLALTNWLFVWKRSPGELRVYDSQNRVTGLVSGEVREEIPDSIYDEESDVVAIFSPSDSYRYRIVSADEGMYGLEVSLVEDGEITSFVTKNIPICPNSVHQYSIDWDALSQGGQGVTLEIDKGGDGSFERTIISDANLAYYQVAIEPLGYELVQQKRVSRTVFEYTFRLRVINSGIWGLKEVTMQLSDVPANTTVIDNFVEFSHVEPAQEAVSNDTFSIRTDRSIEGLESQISWRVRSCTQPKTSDFNYDWRVDSVDLARFAEAWLSEAIGKTEDIYPDGIVDFKDFVIFAEEWLK